MTEQDTHLMHASDLAGQMPASAAPPLPWAGLLALATAGFITILTEALPAGLLPQMAAGLGVSESMAGQLVSFYALGSLLAAVPLVIATRDWPRKTLLLCAISGFAVVNTITALSDSYALTLVARMLAGVFAGLLWALVAGYASRMVAPSQRGRAIAVAMIGAPLAFSLGIPGGTLLGALVGWRHAFGLMTLMTLVLIAWVMWKVPPVPGSREGRRQAGLREVWAMPGVAAVLVTTLLFVLGHNILYTYIAPYLIGVGLGARVDVALLAFGLASIPGIALAGWLVDRWMRTLVLGSILAFGAAILMLGLAGSAAWCVYAGVALWGLAFGGAPTLFQTASANAAGDSADVAQSFIVTVWNLGIAGGGVLGGLVLDGPGAAALPWAALLAVLGAWFAAWLARAAGFPAIGRA